MAAAKSIDGAYNGVNNRISTMIAPDLPTVVFISSDDDEDDYHQPPPNNNNYNKNATDKAM